MLFEHDTWGLLRLVCAADNIIIMAQGRVSAQGEPLALKAQFGEGYSLSLALKSHSDRYDCVQGLFRAVHKQN